ncbi:Pyridoxamine 5'-phosphate oxidase [Thermomonospora echinospora]|uniref:Pyridoxamine 5'-phosphate oxidase n=1 Tax=Thermomonospora echinospora TaxID=1992 RepID=A0A1H6EC14_9ACTN|nr:pyridoxamine 5'-phosphate oxidase family protein [Thermomonospora echinospora]SEG94325.1 Pyridoxamine 5'-phosphate oxidase [Thermomonospora echinospora]
MNHAAGSGEVDDRKLEELDRQECLELISPGGVGRVAFDDGEGPALMPVNYVVDGESVVFQTSVHGRLSRSLASLPAGAETRIAFGVDWIDDAAQKGWSVMLRGGAHRMSEEENAAAPRVESWAGGEREAHFRLTPTSISGRRVHRG